MEKKKHRSIFKLIMIVEFEFLFAFDRSSPRHLIKLYNLIS